MAKAKHETKLETRDGGYCGDHYCTGHHDQYLVCSCGHEEQVFPRYPGTDYEERRVRHVLVAEGLMSP